MPFEGNHDFTGVFTQQLFKHVKPAPVSSEAAFGLRAPSGGLIVK